MDILYFIILIELLNFKGKIITCPAKTRNGKNRTELCSWGSYCALESKFYRTSTKPPTNESGQDIESKIGNEPNEPWTGNN